MTTQPSEWNDTSSVNRAWVPTTRPVAPEASFSRRAVRALPLTLDVKSSTDTSPPASPPGPSRSPSNARTAEKCCSASTSVGTMSAPWCPLCTAASNAASATTVLPEPTSPWSRRCMGKGPAMSATITARARRWAVVSS